MLFVIGVKTIKISHFILALSVVAVWGANAAVGKIAVMQIPAITFLVIRFAITGLLFLPFAKLKKGDLKKLFITAILMNVFHYGFVFSSMKFLEASNLALIQQSQVPMAVLLGVLILKESFKIKDLAGLILAFTGMVIIFGIPSINVLGFSLAILGSLAWAVGSLYMKQLKDINLYAFTAYTTLFSAPFLFVLSLFFDGSMSDNLIGVNWHEINFVLFYQIIICSFAMMAWQRLLAKNKVNKIVPVTLLQPIFGIIGGVILFNEKIVWQMIVGGLITAMGLSLIIIKKNSNDPKK